MKRQPKKPAPSSSQPSLTAPLPAPPEKFELPRLLRYLAMGETGERWQVERFDLLVAGFAMVVKSVAEAEAVAQAFHAFAVEHPRQWQIVRRLFGIAPVVPSADSHDDDLRIWTREELVAEGIYGDLEQIEAELEVLRVLWRDHLNRTEQSRQAEAVSTKLEAPPGELALDDKLLETFQFSERIFKVNVYDPTAGEDGKGAEVPRGDTENRIEREWFTKRVIGWQKMLQDPMGGPVARSALMNDLHLRRLEYEIAVSPSNRRDKLLELQQRLTKDYNTAIEKLQEMFPDLAVAGRITFRAVLSDVIVAHRDYYARADRRLVDKVFTASEIEFQLRSSLQLGAQHRFSLGLAIVENIHGMYDPEFRSQFKPSTLKKIDAMTKAAREAARELQNEPVVDLERGVSPEDPDQFDDFNDEQCPEQLKDGTTCGKWHPSGKKCPNAAAHDRQ
jgi:hypothetical protein